MIDVEPTRCGVGGTARGGADGAETWLLWGGHGARGPQATGNHFLSAGWWAPAIPNGNPIASGETFERNRSRGLWAYSPEFAPHAVPPTRMNVLVWCP